MKEREFIAALAIALVIFASPATALTVHLPDDMVLTDDGFRRAEDCRAVWRTHDWHAGHYWSVRETLDCSAGDAPYGAGKVFAVGDWLAPEPLAVTPAPIREAFTRSRSVAPVAASCRCDQPSIFASAVYTTHIEEPTPPAPPIPLPGSVWLMLSAVAALLWKGRKYDR